MPSIPRCWRFIIVLSTVAAVLAGGSGAYYRWAYPYGSSHSCDKALMFAFGDYARDHGGAYPAGEATPEASLSLLYPRYVDAEVIRGKTVPTQVVQSILDRGERLGPDTCGWHYVAGLRSDDDPRLALCWDKVGLRHFGERLSDGGHFVIFVNPTHVEYIEGAKWAEFLEEQKKLHEERKEKMAKNG